MPMRVIRFRSKGRAGLHALHVAKGTGPLNALLQRSVLVLADVENLSYSARDLGYKLSYQTLGSHLLHSAKACWLHAVFSRQPGDERRVAYFTQRGWRAHVRDIQTVRTPHGVKRLANADELLLFTAGRLISHSCADVVLVGSGDGNLVCELAAALAALPKPRQVVTLSLAGSTSQRLDTRKNPNISGNVEIGLDCLRPMQRRGRR